MQNLRIYIGEDTDYTKNAECPGSPFLKFNDLASSYVWNPVLNAYTLKGGFEVWCNLQGQYTTLVFDYSEAFAYDSSYLIDFTICSLGIFGTNYIRTEPVDLENLSVASGQDLKFTIPHVTSELTIGTKLEIHLRAATEQDSYGDEEVFD